MSAAVVLKHQTADINIRSLIEDAVSDCCRTSLAATTAYDPCRYVLLGIHTVDHESVACIDGIDSAKIGYDHIAFNSGMSCKPLLELGCLLVIYLDTLLNIGHIQDLLCRLRLSVYHQHLH